MNSHISLEISLFNQRAFFNRFNSKNDINAKTGRAGIKIYQNKGFAYFIAWLFNRIITLTDSGGRVYHFNKGSLKKWFGRHGEELKSLKSDEIHTKAVSIIFREKYIYSHLYESIQAMHEVAVKNPFLLGLREGYRAFCAKAYVHYLCNLYVLHKKIEEIQDQIILEYGANPFVKKFLYRSNRLLDDIHIWCIFESNMSELFARQNSQSEAFITNVLSLVESSTQTFVKRLEREHPLFALGAIYTLYGTLMSGGQEVAEGVKKGFLCRILDPTNDEEREPQLQKFIDASSNPEILEEMGNQSISFFTIDGISSIKDFKQEWHKDLDAFINNVNHSPFTIFQIKQEISNLANLTIKEFLGFIESMLKRLASEKPKTTL